MQAKRAEVAMIPFEQRLVNGRARHEAELRALQVRPSSALAGATCF